VLLQNRLLNKACGSFSSISLIAFIGVNFEKSFNRTKKSVETLRYNKYLNLACREVAGFAKLLNRFERNISVL
jgi:hypothetical protein